MRTRRPEIIVFAGPNGSGKSSLTRKARIVGQYINADEIKKELHCSDVEAAEKADYLREQALKNGEDFTFETVMSTNAKIKLLRKAKEQGYFIRCIYVLTRDPNINVYRVVSRMETGGHGVPADKVISRYNKCMELISSVFEIADTFYLYDNSDNIERIAVKKRGAIELMPNDNWCEDEIRSLINKK